MTRPTGPTRRKLGAAEVDRAAGAVLASACGDALGAGYEFTARLVGNARMLTGSLTGNPPGSWTDDTELANCVLEIAATGADLTTPDALDGIAGRFADWYATDPPDVGTTTRHAFANGGRSASELTVAAAAYHQATGRTAGNGSLMRTGPVALAYLHLDPGPATDDAIARAARAISDLTHHDPEAGDACVLWSIAIDRGIRERRIDGIDDALALLPADRRARWADRIAAARTQDPNTFTPNGSAALALQAAYAALWSTTVSSGPGVGPAIVAEILHTAIRIGDDTDTVAAIAGALAGAVHGATTIPFRWRRMLRGWPGLDAGDLVRLAGAAAVGADNAGWPTAATLTDYYRSRWPQTPYVRTLPFDDGVTFGNVSALDEPGLVTADAIVSLCRIGHGQRRGTDHHEVWLVDTADAGVNPNLDFVLADAADAIAELRREGKTVYLHCVHGASRTPTVAVTYLHRHHGVAVDDAVEAVAASLPVYRPNSLFRTLIEGLEPGDRFDPR